MNRSRYEPNFTNSLLTLLRLIALFVKYFERIQLPCYFMGDEPNFRVAPVSDWTNEFEWEIRAQKDASGRLVCLRIMDNACNHNLFIKGCKVLAVLDIRDDEQN